jgi:hypothetical protein
MAITLYCPDAPSLKLGPGLPGTDDCIVFSDGYADVEDDQVERVFGWIAAAGSACPPIRVLEADEGRASDPNAPRCDQCGKVLRDEKALRGHLLSHRPRK